jgi:nucleoside-diphosphate-sugar epimerase
VLFRSPGRIPRRADLVAGRPLAASPDAYLNLIHVDDAARVVLAASGGGAAGTYTISDGSPTTRGEYFGELARLLGAPAPQFEINEEQSPRRAATSKRVRNDRMVRELGVRLKYPSYREGLAAVVEGESDCRDAR